MAIGASRGLALILGVALCGSVAAQTGPINLSGTFDSGTGPWIPQVTLSLDAGDYLIEYMGRSDGAEYVYDAWNCSTQGNCWANEFFVQTSSETSFYGVQWPPGDPHTGWRTYPTPAAALAGARAALPSIPLHLAKAEVVGFGIADYPYSDNAGGISLAISSAAPEPGTWALLASGLALVVIVGRRRQT